MEARCSPTHTPKCFGSHLPRASAWGEPLPPPAIPLLSKADQMVGAIPGQLQVREQTHRSSPTKLSGRGDGYTRLMPGSPSILPLYSPTHSAPSSQNDPSGALESWELELGVVGQSAALVWNGCSVHLSVTDHKTKPPVTTETPRQDVQAWRTCEEKQSPRKAHSGFSLPISTMGN